MQHYYEFLNVFNIVYKINTNVVFNKNYKIDTYYYVNYMISSDPQKMSLTLHDIILHLHL